MAKQKARGSGRKNMNLSAKIFNRLKRIKRREEESIDRSVSWDRFFSEVADREERRGESRIDV